ncbi:MAG: LL-diaminopimelate aminotransferase [Candidatus Chloroheliales bacterium]|nr:MAG: LL-diaminopimelate aminotransferase [Chloroflexota bacterium]
MKFATRISNLPPYLFAELNKSVNARRKAGIDVINFGIGDPDVPPPSFILDSLSMEVRDPKNMAYPNYYGLPETRQAIADWYKRRFLVSLEPDTEVLPLIGSKEGIANLATAMLDPGDIALVPSPGYPVYQLGTLLVDGISQIMPCTEATDYLPDFDAIPPQIAEQARVMWLNYPNNPTGATVDLDFFKRAVEYAHRYDILIAHDNPYSDIYFDDYCPPSVLQVDGAKEVAVEFNSLSKTYSMAGARIGMVVGNARVVEALGRVKSNIDSGVFTAVQRTAIKALSSDQSWIPQRNKIYERRRDVLVEALCHAGLPCRKPRASLYLWGKVPRGFTSMDFAFHLLDEIGVFVTPGSGFGGCGEGHFRMSLTVADQQVDDAVERLSRLRLGLGVQKALSGGEISPRRPTKPPAGVGGEISKCQSCSSERSMLGGWGGIEAGQHLSPKPPLGAFCCSPARLRQVSAAEQTPPIPR